MRGYKPQYELGGGEEVGPPINHRRGKGHGRGNDDTHKGKEGTGEEEKSQSRAKAAAAEFRKKNPGHYGGNARNTRVHADIKKIIEGVKELTFDKIKDACNKSWFAMKQCNNLEEGICPAFATGLCTFSRCQARHLFGAETPKA